MGSLAADLPYWQVNVPEDERTEECPEFLRVLNAKDKRIVSTPDSEHRRSTWPEVQGLIRDNRLDLFQRVPSDLRKYLAYNWKLKQDYGSVMDFILSRRLQWDTPITPKAGPFENEDDVKILWNDWPYGIDRKIVHLVVWTKFYLQEASENGDLTDKARAEIETYVAKVFGSRIPKDRYIWFKNWRSLKSIQSLEHFHVMIYDPDPAFIDEVTNGDVPLSRKL